MRFSFLPIASVTSFSCVPRRPIAPGSSPPWPGSSATVIMRCGRPGVLDFGLARTARAPARAGRVSARAPRGSRAPRATPSADRAASADRDRARRGIRTRRPASTRRAGRASRVFKSNTMRSVSGGFVPKRIAAMYGIGRLDARRQLRELGRELHAVELEHDAMRIRQRRARDARRNPAPRTRRACIPARARCARTRCARCSPTRAPARRAAPPAPAATGTGAAARAKPSISGSHPASTADHRGQASLTILRMRRQRELAPGRRRIGRIRERQREIRLRQPPGDPLGPFDEANRAGVKAIGESRRFPFAWIGEPIKIKVIKV